jgi:hypothetical protein
MADLLMAIVDNDTSDDEIKAFLVKYGFPPFDGIARMQGDGSRPSVLLTFNDMAPEILRTMLPHIQGMFWHKHTIHAQVLVKHDI